MSIDQVKLQASAKQLVASIERLFDFIDLHGKWEEFREGDKVIHVAAPLGLNADQMDALTQLDFDVALHARQCQLEIPPFHPADPSHIPLGYTQVPLMDLDDAMNADIRDKGLLVADQRWRRGMLQLQNLAEAIITGTADTADTADMESTGGVDDTEDALRHGMWIASSRAIQYGGSNLALPPLLHRILFALIKRLERERWIPRQALSDEAWPDEDALPEPASLKTQVSKLQARLRQLFNLPNSIKLVQSSGEGEQLKYRLLPNHAQIISEHAEGSYQKKTKTITDR